MFHAASVHVPQYRRQSALRTFVTSSFSSPPESKEPVRRGILFMAVAGVLLLIGSILTWLGFNDVFGGKISMTGPLLIALALLLLLLSTRQFLKARKHSREQPNRLQLGRVGQGTLRAVVVDRNDRLGAVTVIMDSLDVDNNYTNRHGSEDYAPPSYSEVAEITTTNNMLRPYSNSDEEEPPPPYDDVILPSDNMMTLHLPKYETIMGRRSPVPKYEDIFRSTNLPGSVPSPRNSICHSHGLLSPTNHLSSCMHCANCSSNSPGCISSRSPSSSPRPSVSCIQHTCSGYCSPCQGHLQGSQGHLQGSQGHLQGSQGHPSCSVVQGQNTIHLSPESNSGNHTHEGQVTTTGQCHIQPVPYCRGHSPCFGAHVTCACSHSPPPPCSPCSPHQHQCSSTHFTYPCHCVSQSTLTSNQDQVNSMREPINIRVTAYTNQRQGTSQTHIIDQSNYRLDDSDGQSDQSEVLISQEELNLSNLTLGRSYGTPTQDTEHTF